MKKTPIVLLSLFLLAANLNAALILSDQFSYTNGPVVGSFGSPWLNHSGTAGTMTVTNAQLRVAGAVSGATEDVNAPLAGSPYATNGVITNLYSSMTIICNGTNLPTGGGTYIAHFKDPVVNGVTGSGFSFRARVFANTSGAAAGKYRIGIGNSSLALTPSPQLTNELETNITYTVVTRLNLVTAQSTLWLNPTNETDISIDALDIVTNPVSINAYAFRQATGGGNFLIDDVFVGTAFKDVAGTNRPPFITGIPNQRIAFNTSTTALPLSYGDKETIVSSLILSSNSSDTVLVPNANIVISNGALPGSKLVTVTPANGEQGVATITLTVTDGDGNISTSIFTVTVGAPSIADIQNQETAKNTTTSAIAFTVGDNESLASSLTLTGDSSNTNLVMTNNIVFGGSDSNRTVTITPEPNQTGLSTITVTVSDGKSTTSDTFVLTVYRTDLGVVRCDNFNRPNGPLVDGTGAWISYAGTPIFGTPIAANKVTLSQSISEKVAAGLSNASPYLASFDITSGNILYASFHLNYSQLPTTTLTNFLAAFKDDTGGTGFINHRARIFVTATNAAPGTFRLGIANSLTTLTTNGIIATNLATNTTHFVVVKFNVGTGESALWVNPTSVLSPSLAAPDTFNPFLLAMTTFAFKQDPNQGTCTVDDLRIGGTFADVTFVPSLSVARSGSDVQISWATNCVDYVLESTPTLSPASWSVAAQTPTVVGNQNVVTITSPTDTVFYRLRD